MIAVADSSGKEILSDLFSYRNKPVSLPGQGSLYLDDRSGLRWGEVTVQQMSVERVDGG